MQIASHHNFLPASADPEHLYVEGNRYHRAIRIITYTLIKPQLRFESY